MPLDVTIKNVEALTVLSLRKTTALADLQGLAGNTYITFLELLKESSGASITGKIIQINHGEVNDDSIDVELCVPVSGKVQEKDNIKFQELSGVRVASAIVRGGYDDKVFPGIEELNQWISNNGHKKTGNTRFVYLKSPADTPNENEWETELQIPI
eukprot:TRINITY_DN13395_c0_g1_i1.p1 TRINITY_DN13395_c0_g1~~TRINITY_DN13395_c0_g1_i1.p1  ORF type:complete len:156 (+),score=21.82 TRINITY_DN13395_c0_g1_i1:27-494(+)